MKYYLSLILTIVFFSNLTFSKSSTFIDKKEEPILDFVKDFYSKKCENKPYCKILDFKENVKEKPVSLKLNNIKKNQEMPFQLLVDSLKKIDENKLEKFLKRNINGVDCNSKNYFFSILSVVDLDKNKPLVSQIYSKLNECLVEDRHESVYLKLSLFFRMTGDFELSKKAIKNVLLVSDKNEVAKIWYWAYVILEDPIYSEFLFEQRPYSYQATKLAEKLNYDLLKKLDSRNVLAQEDESSILDFYIKQLLIRKEFNFAYDLLDMNLEKISSQQIQHYAELFEKESRPDIIVKLINRIAYKRPEVISSSLIRLSFKKNYFSLLDKYSKDSKIDPYLLLSLVKQESGFYHLAKSSAKAHGLMQILPSTAKSLTKKKVDLFDIESNIEIGTLYFGKIMKNFNNNLVYSLASYNAGPGNVKKWIELRKSIDSDLFADLIPFKETRIYVASILRNHYFYNKIYNEGFYQ